MFEDRVGRRKTDASTFQNQRDSKRIRGDMAMSDLKEIEREKQAKLSRLRAARQDREAGAGQPTEPAVPTVPSGPIVPTADLIAVVTAIREAQLALASYVEPGKRNADRTIDRLLAILDRNDVVAIVDRLEVELGVRFP